MTAVRFHPEAAEELGEIAFHYEQQRTNLGRRFLIELDASLDLLVENPGLGSILLDTSRGPVRRLVMRRFPLSIVYQHDDSHIVVVAIAHHSRQPGFWSTRID